MRRACHHPWNNYHRTWTPLQWGSTGHKINAAEWGASFNILSMLSHLSMESKATNILYWKNAGTLFAIYVFTKCWADSELFTIYQDCLESWHYILSHLEGFGPATAEPSTLIQQTLMGCVSSQCSYQNWFSLAMRGTSYAIQVVTDSLLTTTRMVTKRQDKQVT